MKPKILAIVILLLTASAANAQLLDKYGLSIGTSYARQNWDYKLVSFNPNFDFKFGMAAFLFAEKNLSSVFSLKTELGYIQKGFAVHEKFRNEWGELNTDVDENTVLRNAELKLGLKIQAFPGKHSPYALAGLYGDYQFSYKAASFVDPSNNIEYKINEPVLKAFNKATMGAFAGAGVELNKQVYIELVYSPALSNAYNDESLKVKDRTIELKLGVQLNQIKNVTLPKESTN